MIYLLDTNIVSYIIKGEPTVRSRLIQLPIHQVAVSVVTQAELLFGVAKRGYPSDLVARVNAFLACSAVLPWTTEVARVYAQLRPEGESKGVVLAPMDLMIAAHAACINATLVTRDQAFGLMPGLRVERWAA